MGTGATWWKESQKLMETTPLYIAEGVSQKIAMQVNQALLAKGLKQNQLATKLGVSSAYISEVLGGKTNLTLLSLAKLAVALDYVLQVDLLTRSVETKSIATPTANYSADPVVDYPGLGNRILPFPLNKTKPTPLSTSTTQQFGYAAI